MSYLDYMRADLLFTTLAGPSRALMQANGLLYKSPEQLAAEGLAGMTPDVDDTRTRSDHFNAIEHSMASAIFTQNLGRIAATAIGDAQEFRWGNRTKDSWADQWNNEVGRRIVEWADANGYENDHQAIQRLILDAARNNQLVTTPVANNLPDAIWSLDPIPLWTAPSPSWMTAPFNEPDYTGLIVAETTNNFFLGVAEVKNWLSNIADDTAIAIENSSAWVSNLLGSIRVVRDPLVLDLDRDGVELTTLSSSTAHFDLDGNGFAERTGWVSAHDGLLSLDVNANGKIDDISELFGNAFSDGFMVLRQYDANADNKITAADAVFSQLRVWRDINQDGISSSSELLSLSSLGISEISLASTVTNLTNAGNTVIGTSTFKMNGVNAQVAAVNFATDVTSTKFILPESFTLDPEVLSLPNLKGYGTVPDLWVAMSMNSDLKAAVQSLVNSIDSIGDLVRASGQGASYISGDFDKMLSLWAGVSASPTASQLADVAAAFQGVSTPALWRGSSQFLEAFETLSSGYAVRFYAQLPDLHIGKTLSMAVIASNGITPANGADFSASELDAIWQAPMAFYENAVPLPDRVAGLRYDTSSDTLLGNPGDYMRQLGAGISINPATPWLDFSTWSVANGAIAKAIGFPDVAVAFQYATGYGAMEIVRAGGSLLQGSSNSDYLSSSSYSTAQRDLLNGLGGNDYLYGGQGSDTYLFGRGSGSDVVSDALGARDEIIFKGFSFSEASFSNPSGNNLLISMVTGESVLISDYFRAPTIYVDAIEAISFDDRFALSIAVVGDIVTSARMSSGSDIVTGFSTGTSFASSAGNDTLIGLSGNDTYHYRNGSGFDVIRDAGGSDTLVFDDAAPYRISFSTDVSFTDLVVTIDGSLGVTLGGGMAGAMIDRFVFQDGTQRSFESVWSSLVTTSSSFATVQANQRIFGSLKGDAFTVAHTGASVFGFDGNDIFNLSGSGSNTLYGGGGNDTFNNYGSGSAITYVFGGEGNDRLNSSRSVIADMGAGNDHFSGSSAYEVVNGGDGDDYFFTQGGKDLIDGGNGIDEVEFYGEVNLKVDLAIFEVDYNGTKKALVGIENVYGSQYDDVLKGDAAANRLTGWLGNDTLEGRDGADFLSGGAGNDILRGGEGGDGLNGDAGNDILDGGGSAYDTAYFYGKVKANGQIVTNNGTVTITDISTTGTNFGTDTLIGVESLYFDNGYVSIVSPIILDMDGNGVGLLEMDASAAAFDMDADGLADRTGWMASGDGILVFDRDGDRMPSGVDEISFTGVEGARSDLDGLRSFDSDGDGALTANDTDFARFGVWVDAGSDGIAANGEFRSLADLGITSIDLGGQAVNRIWEVGQNIVVHEGSFVMNGEAHDFADVGFVFESSRVPMKASVDDPFALERASISLTETSYNYASMEPQDMAWMGMQGWVQQALMPYDFIA